MEVHHRYLPQVELVFGTPNTTYSQYHSTSTSNRGTSNVHQHSAMFSIATNTSSCYKTMPCSTPYLLYLLYLLLTADSSTVMETAMKEK